MTPMAKMILSSYNMIHQTRYILFIYILIGFTSGSGGTFNEHFGTIPRTGVKKQEPIFHLPVMNVTYVAGTTAILPCSVEHLGGYSIVWANPKAITVTLQDRRITDDSRISVERPTTTSWNLHIREVEPSDGGIYSCHINTSPVKVKRIDLIVQVPPKIIDHLSSVDANVREGETVSLVCNVTGIPQPTVTWYRQKRHEGGVKEQVGPPGEVLIIHNVTRYCDDIYTCEASNGVPPNSYRKIAVKVLFLPDVRLPIKRMGQIRGKETILDCMITAVPLGGMSWERNGITLKKSWKYRIEPYDESGNSYTLSIRIIDLNKDDFGEYTCVASNILGEDQETMILYDATAEKEQISSPRGGYVKHNHDKKKNSTIRKNGKSNYPPRTDIRSDIPTPPDDTRSPHRLGGTLFPPNIGSGECRLEWNGRLSLSLVSLFIALLCFYME
uniref:Opioid-binding protein/cell adhesion molecule-like protein isoform X2 n=1 Tax=Octopus vulgaris TaxID=6645 RepID=A0A6C0PN57_OCTVU|nr:opioid-binding protein/cell adhesion molecule-like protein isoform X2 [Octopus vulgaris]